jgi:hypothetical protein
MAIQVDNSAEIKMAIQSGNKDLARELLRSEIKDHPSADTWYLASLVASSSEQNMNFLKRAIDADPFHDQAIAALDKLKSKQPEANGQVVNGVIASNLLNDSIALFMQHDWELKVQMQNMAQLEKRKTVSKITSFLVIFIFGFIGMLIVIAGIATAKKEKISLQIQPEGNMRVIGNNLNTTARDASELAMIAASIKDGVTYGGAIAFGILMTIVSYVVLVTL